MLILKVFNIKLDVHKISYIFIICIIILLSLFLISLFINSRTIYMNNNNYTSILKEVHDDIPKFVGRKIVAEGYVFRANDFKANQFVVARDMLINEESANIVGFLCEYDNINDFENNVWVEIYGTITLGNYYGPMPIIKVNQIKRITTPQNVFVLPPQT